ncbi:hypothetical protein KC345_g11530, partial [Hortaea werneckii]
GFAHALKDGTLPEPQRLEYLSIIDEESRRLSMLSKQLLTLSSLDYDEHALQKRSFELRAQLRQVMQIMEWHLAEKGLAVRLHVGEIMLEGDPNLLYQVWMNLVSNAVKYTPAGGTISIAANVTDQNCIVTVTDDGVGIPADQLPMIFDRFYKVDQARTRDSNSSGLGLAIALKIIQAHNGTLEAASTVGEGTTFTVTLPFH